MKYWFETGRFQKEYEEMMKANFAYTKQEKNARYKYYRYYNDGDLPKGNMFIDKFKIESYLEHQADIAIAKAYLRFNPNCDDKIIHYFAKKTFKGLKTYYEC